MTLMEVEKLCKKIKSFYQYFEINDDKVKDWYVVLRNYDFNDIASNLNKHVSKYENSSIIPTVAILLEGLKSKKKVTLKNYDVYCKYCGGYVLLTKYNEHIDKCISIDYFLKEYERITGKTYKREKLEKMDNETFREQYNKLLKFIKNKPQYNNQELVIDKILGIENSLTIDDVMKGAVL